MTPNTRPLEGKSQPEFRPFFLLGLVAIALAVLYGGYEILERQFLLERIDMEALHRIHLIRGILISTILASIVGLYLYRHSASLASKPSATGISAVLNREERRRQYVLWFVQMRWAVISMSLAAIVLALPITQVLPTRALIPLMGWWLLLAAGNVAFGRWARAGGHYERQIMTQAALDLVVLTGFLNASGGLENPLYTVYLIHAIIAAILLPTRKAAIVTLVAGLLFLVLAFGEYFHLFPHYTNRLFPHELPLTDSALDGHSHGGSGDHASYDIMFVLGRTAPFLLVLTLTAYLTSVIMLRVRASEYELERTAHNELLERRRLEGVVDAAGVGMMQVDPQGALLWLGSRISDWFGWDDRDLGRPCPLLGGTNACPTCIAATAASTGRPSEAERREVHPNGAVRYFRHITTPVTDDDGSVLQIVEVIEDITHRRALEAEAAHAGRLTVLGRMAAGIAHEIGNPLASLSTRLSRLEKTSDPKFMRDSVAVLRGQIGRIERIVHGVSHFGRLRRQQWTTWEINDVVVEATSMVKLDRRAKNVEFVLQLADLSPRVKGVRDQALQILINLLLNAVEAMPEGGSVTIETARHEDTVITSVLDTGPGLDESAREHLFEPFFTTKPQGTGLGLSISYSLAHAHGGSLTAEPGPGGQGSRFNVVLPLAPESGTARDAAR